MPALSADSLFYAISGLMLFCGLMVITRRNPIASAVYLIGTLFLAAALFAFMGADFIAAIQVLVYAGAIMVLFLFVIMLLNINPDLLRRKSIPLGEIVVLLFTIIGFTIIGFQLLGDQPVVEKSGFTESYIQELGGNTKAVGMVLFMKYIWPFELASILILLAIVASVVIAKKQPSQQLKGDTP